MPALRHTSATAVPSSAWRNMKGIYASVNFDLFKESSFSRYRDHKWKIPAQNGPESERQVTPRKFGSSGPGRPIEGGQLNARMNSRGNYPRGLVTSPKRSYRNGADSGTAIMPHRLDALTGLRFFAALLIVFHHLPGNLWFPLGSINWLNTGSGVSFLRSERLHSASKLSG